MVHTRKWRSITYRDGTMMFKHGNKFIEVHRAMGRYWIDYGLKDGNTIGTLRPVKTLRGAMRKVEQAKEEFVLMEKR